jgi:hypothetical protein
MRPTAHSEATPRKPDAETAETDAAPEMGTVPSWSDRLYDAIDPVAGVVKVFLQMVIGGYTAWYLMHELFKRLAQDDSLDTVLGFDELSLGVAGTGLAVAAAIELAYTLFTKGPDEAVDPLILGISAFGLIEVSREDTHLNLVTGGGALLLTLAILTLFMVRTRLPKPSMSRPRRASKPKAGSAKRGDDSKADPSSPGGETGTPNFPDAGEGAGKPGL